MSNYMTQLHIPVRRHRGDFDDFFINRWHELNPFRMDSEFDRRLKEWESQMEEMKRDLYEFSPFVDSDRYSHHYDSPTTIRPGPSGQPEFAVRFDVKDFKPEEINVTTKAGRLEISAAHEEQSEHTMTRKKFKRSLDIPRDVQVGLMRSTLSQDGILSITAPVKTQEAVTGTSGRQALQQTGAEINLPVPSGVTREADVGDALNYSLSIAGYEPEEITVKVEGKKVVVHAIHEETSDDHKVHNEMTKSFDLPANVDPSHVRSYIKDGSTLFVEAHLRDGLDGKIHLLPVTHKPIEEQQETKDMES